MFTAKWFLFALSTGLVLAGDENRQPSAQPSDITSINGLQEKQARVDPKLRKALLRVLSRIKEEENGRLPADLPEEEFFKVIGEPARAEDLGSFEANEEQAVDPNFPYVEAFNFGQKLVGAKSENNQEQKESNQEQNENNQGGNDSVFQGYFINQPGSNYDAPQATGESYHYDRPSSGSFGSSEESDNESKSNNAGVEGQTTSTDQEVSTYPNDISSETSLTDVSKSVEAKAPQNESEGPYQSSNHSEEESTEFFKKDGIETTLIDDGNNSDPVSSTDKEDVEEVTKPTIDVSGELRPVENYIHARAVDNIVQLNDEESTIVSSNQSYSSKYSSGRSTSNFLPTKPSIELENSYDSPSPTEQPTSDITLEKTSSNKLLEANEDVKEEVKKDEKVKHIVEFASSPLITAFTVQQDDKGVPHRIIPLDYVNPTKPPATTEDPEVVAQRHRELEEKEFILQQQLRSLQQEKYKYTGEPKRNQEEILLFQREELRRQQEIQQQLFQRPQLTSQQQFQQPQLTSQVQLQQSQLLPQQQFQQPQLVPQTQFQQPQLIPQQQFQQSQLTPQQRHVQQLPQGITQRPHQQNIQQNYQVLQQQNKQQNHQVHQQQDQQYRHIQPQQPLVQPSIQHSTQLYQRQQVNPNQQQFQSQLSQQELFNQQTFQQNYQRQPFIQQSKALSPEDFLKQQELLRYQQNYQRQQELYRQQELQRQQELLRRQQLERQRFNQRFPFIPNQGLELQKSVDFHLPLFDHNRVHRNEPPYFVNNFGYNRPVTISGQIQNLISQSGISTGLPKNTQTDLSIVSKILALDHESRGIESKNNIKRQQTEVPNFSKQPT